MELLLIIAFLLFWLGSQVALAIKIVNGINKLEPDPCPGYGYGSTNVSSLRVGTPEKPNFYRSKYGRT